MGSKSHNSLSISFLLSCAIFMASILGISHQAQAAAESSAPVGEVRSFVGQVSVSLEGKSWRPLSGDKLPLALKSGDWLRTQNGRAEFYYYGAGSVLKLMENTVVKLQDRKPKESDTKLRDIFTKFGNVWSDIKPEKGLATQFSSSTAVAGIRGTILEWIVKRGTGRSTLDLTQGRVGLRPVSRPGTTPPPAVPVSSNQRSSVARNKPPTPPRSFTPPPQPQIQKPGMETQGLFQLAVVADDNTVELRRVELGPRVEREWIVEAGLEAGERIALDGLQRLRTGMEVIPVSAPAEAGEQKE